MKHLYTILLTLLLFQVSSAQYHGYEIDTFYEEYVPLESYQSMLIEKANANAWIKTFQLPFEFPFFDTTFTDLIGWYDSVWDWQEADDFIMYLFSYEYEFDRLESVNDTNNIQSDVRYSYTVKDDKEVLVVEYFNNRLSDDPSVDEFNSYVNFQNWFYEDGTIEIRFGDFNLDNSTYYVPGEGFWLHVNGDDSILTGPVVGISDPFDPTREIGFREDWEIVPEANGVNTIPDSGFVVRFKRITSSIQSESKTLDLKVFPNPTSDKLHIESLDHYSIKSIQLINTEGITFPLEESSKVIDVSLLPKGQYILKIMTINNEKFLTKIILL
jgi:hypothetical protein